MKNNYWIPGAGEDIMNLHLKFAGGGGDDYGGERG